MNLLKSMTDERFNEFVDSGKYFEYLEAIAQITYEEEIKAHRQKYPEQPKKRLLTIDEMILSIYGVEHEGS